MQSGIPTDRPFLIPRGMGEELGASASHKFFDRSPEVFVGASSAPGSFPPPDNPCCFRLPEWLTAAQTQTRPGVSPLAGGGTIIFEETKDFAAELQYTLFRYTLLMEAEPMEMEQSQTYPKNERRVILWSRNDDPSRMRVFTIGEGAQTRGTKLICGDLEATLGPAFEIDFAAAQEIAEQHRVLPENEACPIGVWTLWTNPQYQYQ